MPLTPEEERRAEELLADAVKEGERRGSKRSLRRVVRSRARSLLKKDYEAATGILELLGLSDALTGLLELLLPDLVKRWRDAMGPVLGGVMEAVTEPAEEVLGTPFDLENPVMAEFLDDYVSELAGRVGQTTHDQVVDVIREAQREGLSVPQTAERIREKAGVESEKRAKLIASNELQRSSKGAAWVQALDSGVVAGKRRNEVMDTRTRPAHRTLDGEERAIDERYSNGEMWCGERDINCRGIDEFLIDYDALEARQDGSEESSRSSGGSGQGEGGAGDPGGSAGGSGGSSGGGGGTGGGSEDPDEMIREAFAGRELTEEEIGRIAHHVAERGFDLEGVERAGRDVAGMEWEGEEIASNARLRPDVRHYLKHVVLRGEWPEDTTLRGYRESVRDVVLDPETSIFISYFRGRQQIGFVRPTGDLRGPGGSPWVLVEYVLRAGHVLTAFQPESGLGLFDEQERREIVRWLRDRR